MSKIKRQTIKWASISILVMATIIVLSGCSGQPATDSTAPTPAANANTPAAGAAAVSFKNDVLPILKSRCFECHGGQKTEKGFNITSYEHVMAGSQSGAVVIAGNPAGSKLVQLIQQGKMPKRGPKVLPDQLQMLINWIQAGALNN
jgi:predicted lipoprotein